MVKSSAAIILCHFVNAKRHFIIGQDTPLDLCDSVSLVRGSNSHHEETVFLYPLVLESAIWIWNSVRIAPGETGEIE